VLCVVQSETERHRCVLCDVQSETESAPHSTHMTLYDMLPQNDCRGFNNLSYTIHLR